MGLSTGAWVAAGMVGSTVLGSLLSKGDSAASDAANASKNYYDVLANVGQGEWSQWLQNGAPLLKSLSDQASADYTAQDTAAAAGQTKDSFAAARAAARRSLNLGSGGDRSDRAAAVLAPSYMDEAGAVSRAITDARLSERNRRFNQTAQVTNLYRGFPAQATQALGTAAGGMNSIAGTENAIDAARNNLVAEGTYGGAIIGNAAAKWYAGANNPGAPPPIGGPSGQWTPTGYGGGGGAGSGNYGDPSLNQADFSAGYYRGGGMVRRGVIQHPRTSYADGGGVISGPGSGTSDSIRAKAPAGTYILSADTVSAIGHKKVHDIIEKSGVRPGEGGTSYSGVPIRVSNGEAEIPPETVRYHGKEFFDKLQQKYHRPVMADGDDTHANGGVIKKRILPKSVEDAIFRAMPRQAIGGK